MAEKFFQHKRIILTQSKDGWGGLKGRTTFVDFIDETDSSARKTLGLIYSDGQYSPKNLLDSVESEKVSGSLIEPLSQALLALAQIPVNEIPANIRKNPNR